ncbi:MAG: beta-lactamase family protein [Solobacterium sp.]|nr:beta-lactamase family protein [Solobacterium sp.]
MLVPDPHLLDDVFASTVKKHNKASISAVIFDEEKILYEHYDGLADREQKIRPDGNTLYMIASNTKILTTLGLLRLAEDGKLDLHADIRQYIPELSLKSRTGDPEMTIEDFLMHRSGLVCDLYRYMIGEGTEYTPIIEGLKQTYRTSFPGEMFSYSNLGYTLLGIVIERASGMPYTAFLQKYLFDPLDMNVYFMPEKHLPETVQEHTAKSYDAKKHRTYDPLGNLLPAGPCTYTSIHALLKIGQLILNEGTCGKKKLYRKKTIRWMKELPVKDPLDKELAVIGHGLFHHKLHTDYVTGPFMGHGGNTVYHHSLFDFLPEEKLGIIIFSNYEDAPPVIGKLEKALLNEYLRQAGFPKKETGAVKPVKADITAYTGRYDTAYGPLSFTISDDAKLAVRAGNACLPVRVTEGGWLKVSGPFPPSLKALRTNLLKQTAYFGKDVLIADNNGTKTVVGIRYTEPCINAAWLEAAGTYAPAEEPVLDGYDGMDLKLKDGELIVTVKIIGEDLNYYLHVLNDHEAVVKGFGRNTGHTVTLQKDKTYLYLECDGVRARKKRRQNNE